MEVRIGFQQAKKKKSSLKIGDLLVGEIGSTNSVEFDEDSDDPIDYYMRISQHQILHLNSMKLCDTATWKNECTRLAAGVLSLEITNEV